MEAKQSICAQTFTPCTLSDTHCVLPICIVIPPHYTYSCWGTVIKVIIMVPPTDRATKTAKKLGSLCEDLCNELEKCVIKFQ